LGDIGGGAMYLMTGLLAGIVQARATGRGTVVDAAIVDGAAHMLNLMLHARQRGLVADERGHSIHDSAPFYETYACADGGFITVGAIEPQFHALLLDRLGLADAAAFQGPQWDRAAWPARRAQLQTLFASRPRAHWQQLLEGSDACFGPVLSPVEAARHPHLQARGVYLQPEGGALQASPAPRFDGQAYAPGPANAAGSDTASVREKVSAGRAQEVWRSAR